MGKECLDCQRNCAIVKEWDEEVDEIESDISFLGEAVMGSQSDMQRAIKAYTEIAGQEGLLGRSWNRFVSAQREMDYKPDEFNSLSVELMDRLYSQADGLREEIRELKDGCPGPAIFELDTPREKIIAKICMSPVFIQTDGIEPVHIQRIPKNEVSD